MSFRWENIRVEIVIEQDHSTVIKSETDNEQDTSITFPFFALSLFCKKLLCCGFTLARKSVTLNVRTMRPLLHACACTSKTDTIMYAAEAFKRTRRINKWKADEYFSSAKLRTAGPPTSPTSMLPRFSLSDVSPRDVSPTKISIVRIRIERSQEIISVSVATCTM